MTGNKDNVIYDVDSERSFGFYRDIVALYQDIINGYVKQNDTENIEYYTEQLEEINEFKDYDGLLVLSENNGMGFTCNKYRDDWEIARWVADNLAPEDENAMPKIFNDYVRQKAFMEQVKNFMKGDNYGA